MSTYVLVHGAWHGGWCYRDTAQLLRAQGHTVFTPTLTGNGEDFHHSHQGITLETHIRDVLGVFEAEELSDVVLVGHSYGGMVISGVADRIASKIRRLIHLDAFIPEDGDCLIDCLRKNLAPEMFAIYQAHFASSKDFGMMIPPIPGSVFGANAQTDAWMQRRCNAQALATFTMPLMLHHPISLPRAYILADGWQPTPFVNIAASAQKAGWPVVTLKGGHCLMMDNHAGLADALIELA